MKTLDSTRRFLSGPFLIAIASLLWTTDALVRLPASRSVDPILLVFIEHFMALLVLTPWILKKHKRQIFALSPREWIAAAFCGMGGSALASVFFTAAFLYINPSVAVLLQKLQPVMVVLIATLFLGERPAKKFYFLGSVAIACGIILSFPDLNFRFLSKGVDLHSLGIRYAFGAALIWAISTVSGKILVLKTPASLATFWRFVFGLIALSSLLALGKEPIHWQSMMSTQVLLCLAYLSLIPGILAMLVYYSGLSKTEASVTGFIELLYPIGAVILNTLFLNSPLEPVQMIAGTILMAAVALISF